jgi:succinate dehydrogenase/fumarate reductase cytochrome b subunit
MIIIGIVLSFVCFAYLCWLLFTLAVYALPVCAAVTAALAVYQSGSGLLGAVIVGVIAGSIILVAGQIAFTRLRSPLMRAAISILFALPAAVAGYHAALGLAHFGVPAEGWRQAMAAMGAIVVAATAWARMALSAPPDAGQGVAAGVTSSGPLRPVAKEG